MRGATLFLGVSECTFGTLLFLGFWNKKLGILGALGSTATFIGTATIIPFIPEGWDAAAAGFPPMTGNVSFLMKDVAILAPSCYLLKQYVQRVYVPVAHLARQGQSLGVTTRGVTIDMPAVLHHKREMVRHEVELHLQNFTATGTELIVGHGRFVAPKTLEVSHDGGMRVLTGDRVFLSLGTQPAIPAIPGLKDAAPLTHIEALELGDVPTHLIVVGGGYVGIEMAQAFRRFGSRVTIIQAGLRLLS